MIPRHFIDAGLTGLCCLAVNTVGHAVGVTFAELPDLGVKAPIFDPWNMGAAGFVVWYAWYVTAKVIPKLIGQHGDQMKDQAASHAQHVAALVADFREEAKQIREDNREIRDAGCRNREVK